MIVMVEMQRAAEQVQKKSLNSPDEIQTYPRTRVESVRVGDRMVKRYTFQPGMRWSTDVKPTVQTQSCELPHLAVMHAGRMHFKMEDGSELELGPGDVAMIPGGHDKWTVGNQPAVFVSFE